MYSKMSTNVIYKDKDKIKDKKNKKLIKTRKFERIE